MCQIVSYPLKYTGPAGVVFTRDELLIMWADLCRHPTDDNEAIRHRIANYLERTNGVTGVTSNGKDSDEI
jgi:hypothetical protein